MALNPLNLEEKTIVTRDIDSRILGNLDVRLRRKSQHGGKAVENRLGGCEGSLFGTLLASFGGLSRLTLTEKILVTVGRVGHILVFSSIFIIPHSLIPTGCRPVKLESSLCVLGTIKSSHHVIRKPDYLNRGPPMWQTYMWYCFSLHQFYNVPPVWELHRKHCECVKSLPHYI